MEFSQADMMSDKKLTLIIKYTGLKDMDYTPGRVYTAKKVKKEIYGADNFAIIDDSGESYIVSGDFIRNSFQLLEHGQTDMILSHKIRLYPN